ncbi:AraC family transcriptional regulator [Campylobacter sp. RM9328]|uniref:AraC family transcriptional regulator n=1 Tax=Campylobacter sp. RM9328 TaxID=1705720 RepID=UPI001474F46D|nr:AraC family transcriptional regulator [Campylobacter sp. RM9328]
MTSIKQLKEQTKEFLLGKYGINGLAKSDIDSLNFYISDTTHDFLSVINEPSLCIILQGAKAVGFSDDMYGYDENTYLLSSTHVPLKVRISQASKEQPYISLALKFSLEEVYEVLKSVDINEGSLQKSEKSEKGVFFSEPTDEILEPVLKLVWLLEKPKSKINYLADLAKKEILYTLVTNDKSGYFLSKFAMQGSVSNKISRVIAKIKNDFKEKLSVKELARCYDMSESSLYQNFKVITSLSPLAFQKKIRLEEAKNLLANKRIGVAQVAFDVGYESPSQFSREYARMFGVPPKTHSEILRTGVA